MDLAEPEANSLLAMMDLDRDGAVSADDFMVTFYVFSEGKSESVCEGVYTLYHKQLVL